MMSIEPKDVVDGDPVLTLLLLKGFTCHEKRKEEINTHWVDTQLIIEPLRICLKEKHRKMDSFITTRETTKKTNKP